MMALLLENLRYRLADWRAGRITDALVLLAKLRRMCI